MSNSLKENITDKHVVVREDFFQPAYRDIQYRVFLASGGFGCFPNTRGTAVFGSSPIDGEKFRIDGFDIERYATDEEIQLVSKEN